MKHFYEAVKVKQNTFKNLLEHFKAFHINVSISGGPI